MTCQQYFALITGTLTQELKLIVEAHTAPVNMAVVMAVASVVVAPRSPFFFVVKTVPHFKLK
eukprot:m.39198 g.39198  ORF g.39198 m.39198 type:complete len:62 (+) comp11248_c0_seq1:1928-2113(+)